MRAELNGFAINPLAVVHRKNLPLLRTKQKEGLDQLLVMSENLFVTVLDLFQTFAFQNNDTALAFEFDQTVILELS